MPCECTCRHEDADGPAAGQVHKGHRTVRPTTLLVAGVALLIGLVAAPVLGGGLFNASGSGVFTDQSGNNVRLVAANVRDYPLTGWSISDPTSHAALGLSGVTCDPTGALILTLAPPATGGLTVWATPDERYVKRGLMLGLWMTTDLIGIRMTRVTGKGVVNVDCHETWMVNPNANIWVGGMFVMPHTGDAPTPSPYPTASAGSTPSPLPSGPASLLP